MSAKIFTCHRSERPFLSAKNGVRLYLIVCLALILLIAGCTRTLRVPTQTPLALAPHSAWAHAASDLQVSPELVLGRLPNGFSYVLKRNHTPQNRVSMHLYVQAGSLCEYEGQQGLAHFLEHMLFNGSTHFKPDELVKYFQRIGMRFGPDANAHTGFTETVYDVLLPSGDRQSLAEALLVLRDYAEGALLLPDQIEKEKKVVLSEKRSRDSVGYRTAQAAYAFEMPGTLPAQRFPIGQEKTILGFEQSNVRRFYNTWYRPERMTLVMVGQFDPDQAQDLIRTEFTSMEPRTPAQQTPAFGSFNHQGLNVFYHPEKESGATSVRIETTTLKAQPPDSIVEQKQMLIELLADRIIGNRLDKLLQNPQCAMTTAGISSGYFLQQIRYTEISAKCRAENWETALTNIEQILRQALEHGFNAMELEQVKQTYLSELQKDLKDELTRDSQSVALEIMEALRDRRVMQSAAQRLQLLAPILTSLTSDEVHAGFVQNWSAPHRLVLVTGDVDLAGQKAPAENRIKEVYRRSAATPTEAPQPQRSVAFPYLPPPASDGSMIKHTSNADLGIETVEFANGLRLNLKKTHFKANEILAALAFGNGKDSEPPDQAGLAELTEALLNEAGFGSLARSDLAQALAGRLADITFEVREDMFAVKGESVSDEVELLFELMRTFVLDPGYRPEALEVARKRLAQRYQAMSHDVSGMMTIEGRRFLAGGDSRFGWPTWQRLEELTLEQIRGWLGPALKTPMELTVVGDFDRQTVIALATRYLATLPLTRGISPPVRAQTLPQFPQGQSLHRPVITQIANTLAVVAYPTTDFWDIGRVRRLSLLGEIFSERLRVTIREKLGAAYSPYAYNRSYRAYAGYGVLAAYLQVDPRIEDAIVTQVKQIANELGHNKISADEFRRALDPALTHIRDLRQENSYWLNSVLVGSARHPAQLEWARNIESDYASIRVDEIEALAQEYLDNRRAATLFFTPAP